MPYEITPPQPVIPPPPPGAVILRWLRACHYFEDGIAYARAPGQEDVMGRGEAMRYVSSGQGVIVGKADDPSRFVSPPNASDGLYDDPEDLPSPACKSTMEET